MNSSAIEGTLNILVKSVINFNPEKFKPYIYSEVVKCEAVSKKTFYKFFKRMVCTAKANSLGKLTLKIKETDDPGKQRYSFFDEYHLHARLNIHVIEMKDSIWIDILPF